MRVKVLFLVLIIAACFTYVVTAPQVMYRQNPPVEVHGGYPELPPLDFTMAEFIDVFTDYSLHHSESVGCAQWYGVTDFDRKQIDVCDRYDLTFRRITIIHEALHVIYRNHGLNTGGPYEYAIDKKAQEIYRLLFAFKFNATVLPETPVAPGQ